MSNLNSNFSFFFNFKSTIRKDLYRPSGQYPPSTIQEVKTKREGSQHAGTTERKFICYANIFLTHEGRLSGWTVWTRTICPEFKHNRWQACHWIPVKEYSCVHRGNDLTPASMEKYLNTWTACGRMIPHGCEKHSIQYPIRKYPHAARPDGAMGGIPTNLINGENHIVISHQTRYKPQISYHNFCMLPYTRHRREACR